MAKRTKVPKGPVTEMGERLWLGCFSIGVGGEQTFQMVARAADPEHASEVMRRRILELRKKTSLFDDAEHVYFEALFELAPDRFEVPALVNHRVRVGADGDIWCGIPDQPGATVQGWAFATDGVTEPFVTFETQGTPVVASAPPPPPPSVIVVHRTLQ